MLESSLFFCHHRAAASGERSKPWTLRVPVIHVFFPTQSVWWARLLPVRHHRAGARAQSDSWRAESR